MAMGGGPQRSVKSDINVTPLVDVCLVLLIIFMVITPMLQRGKDVTLPKSHQTDESRRDTEPLIVSVTRDRKMWLDKEECDETQLEQNLSQELARAPTRQILLKGDASLTFGDLRKVMKIAERAHGAGVQLAVEEVKH